jgi:predicted esterase
MATAFATYADLLEEVVRLREAGRLEDALALVEREGARFTQQLAFVHLWRVSLSVALGRIEHAIEAFAEAVAAGCRYPEPMLRDWPAIASLHDIVEFERLAHIAALRYDAELGASHPTLIVERPDAVAPVQGLPLLVVLHGNNRTAEATVPEWTAAIRKGFVLAVPGSAEIALTPGLFVWNDGERAQRDVIGHVERLVREQRVDPERVVVAGFSAGSLRALQLAYGPGIHARAAIAVGPWIPIDEVDALASARPVRTFIAVGDRDRGGYAGSVALAERLREQEIPVRLEVIPGHGHDLPPRWDAMLGDALDFALAAGPA